MVFAPPNLPPPKAEEATAEAPAGKIPYPAGLSGVSIPKEFIKFRVHYVPMKLYVSDSCPGCKIVMQSPWVHKHPTLEIRNVSVNHHAVDELTRSGSHSIPTLLDGSLVIQGAQRIIEHLSR
jgi:hypothetical protein